MKKGDYIGTYTGKQFWPLDPRPEDVCLEDIAHALSQICRFNGHVEKYSSVALHCLNVEMYLIQQEQDAMTKLYGLLHDAAEAYVGDMSRPMKICCPGFNEIEEGVQDAVYQHFGIPQPSAEIASIVKEADDYVLALEARRFMKNTERWGLVETKGESYWYIKDKDLIEAVYMLRVEEMLKKINA